MLTDRPLFVVGMPKSGTSLTVQILNNHQDFTLDFEVPVVLAVIRSYRDTIDPHSNLRHFIDNMALDPLCKKHHDELITSGSFKGLMRSVFGQMHSGYQLGKRWGSTTKPMLNYHVAVTDLYPNAEFLFVLRDPRDIWASLRSWKPGPQWHNAIKSLSMSVTPLPLIERYNRFLDLFSQVKHGYYVRYEDIVQDPAVIFKTLNLSVPAGNILSGIGHVYKTRHLPAPVSEQPFSDTLMDSVGRWKKDVDQKEIEQLLIGCSRLFEMGFYQRS